MSIPRRTVETGQLYDGDVPAFIAGLDFGAHGPMLQREVDLGELNSTADFVFTLCSIQRAYLSPEQIEQLCDLVRAQRSKIESVSKALRKKHLSVLAVLVEDLIYHYIELDGKPPAD